MKVALCFIISNKHIVHKEHLWRKWIDQKKDLFNVYFHYKDYSLIRSDWVRKHCIHPKFITKTAYFHVVPAYLALLNFAVKNLENKWFCLLTESCIPIVSMDKFLESLNKNVDKSILSWQKAYWNLQIHTRANLRLLKPDFQLSNAPWFILTRDHVNKVLYFRILQHSLYKTICEGGLANESVFAIALESFMELKNKDKVINEVSTITDWEHMETPTSPYTFKSGSPEEIKRLHELIRKNPHGLFLRKISPYFPDKELHKIIFPGKKKINLVNEMGFWVAMLLSLFLFLINISNVVHNLGM